MFESIRTYWTERRASRQARAAEERQSRFQMTARAIGDALEQVYSTLRWASGGRRQTVELLQRMRGWVYVCLDLRGNCYSSLEHRYYRQNRIDPSKKELLPLTHWLPRLFAEPSRELPWFTERELRKLLVWWRAVDGRAYLWTPLDGGKYPVKAFVVPPNLVTPVASNDRMIAGWNLSTPLGEKFIPMNEMAYFPRLEPKADLKASLIEGSSLIAAIIDEIDAGEAASQFLANHFRFGAMPPAILESELGTEGFTSPAAFDSWVQRFLEKYQGQNGRAPLGALPPGYKLKEFNVSGALEPMLKVAGSVQEVIVGVMQVPISMVKSNAANYATAKIDDYRLRTNAIEPEAYTIDAIMTRHFRQFEPDLLVEHVPFVWEDPEEIRAQEAHELDYGLISRNDARASRGLTPIPGGDAYEVLKNAGKPVTPQP